MPVVADASPIILLSRVGRLDLLPALYGRLVVPAPVYREVAQVGKPGSADLSAEPWVELVETDPSDPVFTNLRRNLDLGEAAALAVAKALSADLVLMDDRQGRRAAATLGLSVKGTLGILLAAKRGGFLDKVGPLVAALVEQGAWLSPALKRQVLAAAGELDPGG